MFKKDDVTTTRPASTSLLTIDSEDRFQDYVAERADTANTTYNYSPYNFTISKPESMMNGFITRLGVSEIVFPWIISNVNINSYQIQVTSYSGTGPYTPLATTTISLPIGFYSPKELATQVQTSVRGADANLSAFTITYGSLGFCNFQYASGVGSTATAVSFAPVTGVSVNTKQLFDLLGFDNVNINPLSSATGQVTLCQYTRYIDIVCPQLTYNQPLKDTSSQPIVRDSLCRVYLDQVTGAFNTNTAQITADGFIPTGCRPFMIYHNYTHPKQISWTPNQPVPGNLTFQVYDDSGQLMNFSTNTYGTSTNWSMTLLVTEN